MKSFVLQVVIEANKLEKWLRECVDWHDHEEET